MAKKDDGKTNSKSIGFLKLMPISQLDPNKLNSNKEELLPEILVNFGKIPFPNKI